MADNTPDPQTLLERREVILRQIDHTSAELARHQRVLAHINDQLRHQGHEEP